VGVADCATSGLSCTDPDFREAASPTLPPSLFCLLAGGADLHDMAVLLDMLVANGRLIIVVVIVVTVVVGTIVAIVANPMVFLATVMLSIMVMLAFVMVFGAVVVMLVIVMGRLVVGRVVVAGAGSPMSRSAATATLPGRRKCEDGKQHGQHKSPGPQHVAPITADSASMAGPTAGFITETLRIAGSPAER
jgi:hypothetical protein